MSLASRSCATVAPLRTNCRSPKPLWCMASRRRTSKSMAFPKRNSPTGFIGSLRGPGTCSVGYNAIRFDHEHSRFLFYRNLLDPYAWHWRDGNTRWDLIDLFRAAYALRPEGIEWPVREDGKPSFRLQHLAAENGVGGHGEAHEALADVMTTIDMARLVRARQPRLFDWSLRMRDKKEAAAVMQDRFVWVASLFQGRGCAAPVVRIADQPGNSNAVIVFDMSHDPSEFTGLSADALRDRIFSPGSRSPIFVVKTNQCPFVAPFSVLNDEVMDRLGLDPDTLKDHYRLLRNNASLADNVRAAYGRPPDHPREEPDVDEALYTGFIPDPDRKTLARLLDKDRTLTAAGDVKFADRRLRELVSGTAPGISLTISGLRRRIAGARIAAPAI